MKQKDKSTVVAAAKAGMSEKTARKYLKVEALPSKMKKERHLRMQPLPVTEIEAHAWVVAMELAGLEKNEPPSVDGFGNGNGNRLDNPYWGPHPFSIFP